MYIRIVNKIMSSFAKKRGSEKQITSEDTEYSDDDESNAKGGQWERASEDVLAKRKMINIGKRSGVSSSSSSLSASSVHAGESSKPSSALSNPFGSMKSFAPAAAANPFGTLKGFAPSKESQEAAPVAGSSKFSELQSIKTSSQSRDGNVIGAPSGGNSYGDKMLKLNQALMSWMQQQKPVSLWTGALKDYVRHAESIAKEYKVEDSVSAQSFQSQKAPTSSKSVSIPKQVPNPVSAHIPIVGVPASVPVATKTPVVAPASLGGFFTSAVAPVPLPQVAPTPTPAAAQVPVSEKVPTFKPFAFGASTGDASAFGISNVGGAASSFSSFGGSGGFGKNVLTVSDAPLPNVTFDLKGSQISTSSNSTNAVKAQAEDDEVGDDNDYSEPTVEVEKVLPNENDKDEVLFELEKVQLKRLDLKADPKPEWKDVGKGSFRITHDPNTKCVRMLVREKTMGKVTLNCTFFSSQRFEKKDKGYIQFCAVVIDPDPSEEDKGKDLPKLHTFMMRTKVEDTDKTIAALVSARDRKK